MTWATNKAEEMGPVQMEMDWLEEEGRDDREADWRSCEVCDDGGGIGTVYANTRCYHYQGYGHMATECPQRGKRKEGYKGRR